VKRPKALRGPWSLVDQTVRSVVCGPAHTLVVSSGGLVFACGQTEGDGRLGVTAAGWSGAHSLPHLHQVVCRSPWRDEGGGDGPLVKFEQVAAGYKHSVGLSTDGRAFSCGKNREGQLGYPPSPGRFWMGQVSGRGMRGARVVAVAAGAVHSACVTEDGAVYTWGRGAEGQLGVLAAGGEPPRRAREAVHVSALAGERVVAVACGQRSTMALTDDGRVFAWGVNRGGMLGVGVGAGETVPLPLPVLGIDRAVQISCGPAHAAAVVWEGDDGAPPPGGSGEP